MADDQRYTDTEGRVWLYTRTCWQRPVDPAVMGLRCVICGIGCADDGFRRDDAGNPLYWIEEKPRRFLCSAACAVTARDAKSPADTPRQSP